MNYPKMKTIDGTYSMANHILKDPYLLLEDAKCEETLKWVKEENEWTDAWFKNHLNDEVEALKEKYRSLKNDVDYGSLIQRKEGIYATRHNSDGTNTLVCLDKQMNEIQEIHPNVSDTMTLFSINPSLNGEFVLLRGLKDKAGRPSVIVMDKEAKHEIATFDGIFYSLWDKTGTKVIYSDAEVDHQKGCNINSIRVFDCITHKTETIYSTDENAVLIQLEQSQDGNWILAGIMKDYSNILYLAIENETWEITSLNTVAKPLSYGGTLQNEHYFISWDQAPFGKVVAIQCDGKKERIVVEESDCMLETITFCQNELIIQAMKDAHSVLACKTLDEELEWISLPSEYGALSIQSADYNAKNEADCLYFSFESFIEAPQLCKLKNKQLVKVYPKENQIQNNSELEVIQKKITVRDGQVVPCYLVYKKGLKMDGSTPSLMYAYGGYNVAELPNYKNPFVGLNIVDWVKQGGLYVHINIRGGNEYGTKWHEQGMLNHKKNCFYDFIDVASTLQKEGYTSPERTGICGGSNGGLLMCALVTMRPDLWECVIASVPHTDMLRFCFDDRGPMYITEYGNPQQEEMFDYMLSYSPYHNVKETDYPAMIIQTGECDNNVPPYHGKKMAALMQQKNTSDNPILLRVLEKGSHDRGKGEAYIQTISEMQAFLKKMLFK